MRELNECKAEIFRRGDEKKSIRAQRKRTFVSVLLPIFLCAVIIGVLPSLDIPFPTDRTETGAPSDTIGGLLDGGMENEKIPFSVAIVEVERDGYLPYGKKTLTANDFECLYTLICEIISDSDGFATFPEGEVITEVDCTLTFIGNNTEIKFVISGNFLIYNNIQRSLSDDELTKIKNTLWL